MCLTACKQYTWLLCTSTHYPENSCPPGHKALLMEYKGESVWDPHQPHPRIHCQKHLNKEQLGCLSVFQEKPPLTVHNTYVSNIEFQNFLNEKEPSAKSRKEFARIIGFGLTGDCNPTGTDATEFCPSMMHRAFNYLSFVCLRFDHVGNSVLKNKNKWFEKISKVARKINPVKRQIKFDEVGYPVFFERYEQLLKESNFSETVLEILTMYLNGWKVIMPSLIRIPTKLPKEEYEIENVNQYLQ